MSLVDQNDDRRYAERRIVNLKADLERWNEQYRTGRETEVTDRQFDNFMQELKNLEAMFPDLSTGDSPSKTIGAEPPSGWPRVKHEAAMLSIDNVFTIEALEEQMKKVERAVNPQHPESVRWTIEYKVDGCALELVYEYGVLTQALTRGQGGYGDNILVNARTISGIPGKLKTGLSTLPRFEVRGEVYMKNHEFQAWNALQKERKANSRNATAGAIRRLDPKECARTPLRFLGHSIARPQTVPGHITKQQAFCTCLNQEGFETAVLIMPQYRNKSLTTSEVIEFCKAAYDEGSDLLLRPTYEIDGLVIKLDYFEDRDRVGATSSAPRWAFALKMEKYEAVTVLKDVTWQVGKTGVLAPVAELDPVEIAGTIVSRASLFNMDIIDELDLRIGDTVLVEKAGKIIPHIVRVEKSGSKRRQIVPPQHCPACGNMVRFENTDENDPGAGTLFAASKAGKKKKKSRVVRCIEPGCPGKLKDQIRSYAGRESGIDIPGFGEHLAHHLVDQGRVKDIADLYALKVTDFLTVPGMGMKSGQKMVEAIQSRKSPPLRHFLHGLSIPYVGEGTSKRLAEFCGSLDQVIALHKSQLTQIPDIGETTAESVYNYFQSDYWRHLMSKLKEHNVKPTAQQETETPKNGPLTGEIVVATGKLEKFSRHEVDDTIRRYGGSPAGSVTKATTTVVVGDKPGSKKTKAEQLGIRIVYEPEFYAMLGI